MGWKSCHAEREQTRTDIKLTHHLFYLVFSCLLGRAWVFFFKLSTILTISQWRFKALNRMGTLFGSVMSWVFWVLGRRLSICFGYLPTGTPTIQLLVSFFIF